MQFSLVSVLAGLGFMVGLKPWLAWNAVSAKGVAEKLLVFSSRTSMSIPEVFLTVRSHPFGCHRYGRNVCSAPWGGVVCMGLFRLGRQEKQT
jgi:hypothetical protein